MGTDDRASADGLIQPLGGKLSRFVRSNLLPAETIDVCLPGTRKQALLCTNRRVIIAKVGAESGRAFGEKLFQAAYAMITAAEVSFGFGKGYFELSAGGEQGGNRSAFALSTRSNPMFASNCVYLRHKASAPLFNAAALLILERADAHRRAEAQR